jgi:RNA-directed DNA polymerase
MNLESDRQQNIQMELDFSATSAGEAREAGREETESLAATHGPQSPASTNRLMEEVCERENLREAWRRVKANKGSAGVDGITIGGLSDYLKQHGPAIREQLLNGTYEPKPVRRGGNPQTGWRGAQAWHPHGQRELHSIAIRIWDGRRSAIRSIRFAASASKF